MKRSFARSTRGSDQCGQVMLFLLFALGLVLLGAMAFAVDLSNLWFHRQAAQTAADAVCSAGAMDQLVNWVNGASLGNFPQGATTGTTIDCHANPSFAACQYAALNGYSSTIPAGSKALGNNVSVVLDQVGAAARMHVVVNENIPAYFAGLLHGSSRQSVPALSGCGVTSVPAPVPLSVLNPQGNGTLNLQGADVKIYGGGSQTIQVNSADFNAVTASGTPTLDLTQAGTSNDGSVGLWGGPSTPPAPLNFVPGSNKGGWFQPAAPVSDALSSLTPPPLPPPAPPGPALVPPSTSGCPLRKRNCQEWVPGYYPGGIAVNPFVQQGGAQVSAPVAIFDPGLYYLGGDLTAGPNVCLRNSNLQGWGWGGVTFYFSGTARVNIDPSSGSKCGRAFSTNSGSGSLANGVYCSSSSWPAASQLPNSIRGNVLLAPCTGPYGDPYLAQGQPFPSSLGQQRGILFFQDTQATSVQASVGGADSFLGGAIYIHSCGTRSSSSACGQAPTNYSDGLTLSASTPFYVVGSIVVDNLTLSGTSRFNIFLNPTTAYNISKASLVGLP